MATPSPTTPTAEHCSRLDIGTEAEWETLEAAPWCKDALFLVTTFGDGECAILVRGWKALCVRVVDMHFHDPDPDQREEVLSQLVDWEQWDNADGLPYHFSWSYEDGNISVTRVTDDESAKAGIQS